MYIDTKTGINTGSDPEYRVALNAYMSDYTKHIIGEGGYALINNTDNPYHFYAAWADETTSEPEPELRNSSIQLFFFQSDTALRLGDDTPSIEIEFSDGTVSMFSDTSKILPPYAIVYAAPLKANGEMLGWVSFKFLSGYEQGSVFDISNENRDLPLLAAGMEGAVLTSDNLMGLTPNHMVSQSISMNPAERSITAEKCYGMATGSMMLGDCTNAFTQRFSEFSEENIEPVDIQDFIEANLRQVSSFDGILANHSLVEFYINLDGYKHTFSYNKSVNARLYTWTKTKLIFEDDKCTEQKLVRMGDQLGWTTDFIDVSTKVGDYLPLTAGEDFKLTGPLGLNENIGYGIELPTTGFEGQLFFLEESDYSLPLGGSAGQILIKNSAEDGDTVWGDLPQPLPLPSGGSAGQVLIKTSSTDGDAEWKEIVALPKGGSQGQILTKNSSTDGDAVWQNFPELNYLPLSGGTITNGQITFKNTTASPTVGQQLPMISMQYQNADGTYYATKPIMSMLGTGETSTANNTAVRFGSSTGSTWITSGESSIYMPSSLASVNNENLYLTSDSGVIVYTGCANDGTSYTQTMSLTSSKITAHVPLYGAVWNDYAEYRTQIENIEPGYCVASADNGQVYKTTEKFQACDGIVSDTFGFAIGETDECKTPLAVAGRVLAYYEGNRYDYHAGDTVCAGPNGKVVKMTREEIREWPDRIVGIVSEIPEYETWGTGNVLVDGRIWIKIR